MNLTVFEHEGVFSSFLLLPVIRRFFFWIFPLRNSSQAVGVKPVTAPSPSSVFHLCLFCLVFFYLVLFEGSVACGRGLEEARGLVERRRPVGGLVEDGATGGQGGGQREETKKIPNEKHAGELVEDGATGRGAEGEGGKGGAGAEGRKKIPK